MEKITMAESEKPCSGLPAVWRRLREKLKGQDALDGLPAIPLMAGQLEILESPEAYRLTLLALISKARQRIWLATLYLQDDDGGREILEALHAAKAACPELEITVFVDWHRAQRGLIGKGRSAGNAAMYQEMAERFGSGVDIRGVPVQRREFMGVMHLKGFIIDDQVLYSGASLNDVYLQRHGRYRLDRYHLIHSRPLADCLATLLGQTLRQSPAVHPLNTHSLPKTAEIRPQIPALRRELARTRYCFASGGIHQGEIGITPLFGLGVRDNELNQTIIELIRRAKTRLVLFTPYFNPPGPVQRALDACLRSGCRIMIVLGDKTANDFYIPPEEPFKTIGALPYLYENNLRRFCRARQKFIATGQLNVHLWRHGNNTYHLKGLLVDDQRILLTGHNINPRAWRLDLENALLIHDPGQLLAEAHHAELERILARTQRLPSHEAIDPIEAYPPPVQRLLKRLARVRADRLVNQVL